MRPGSRRTGRGSPACDVRAAAGAEGTGYGTAAGGVEDAAGGADGAAGAGGGAAGGRGGAAGTGRGCWTAGGHGAAARGGPDGAGTTCGTARGPPTSPASWSVSRVSSARASRSSTPRRRAPGKRRGRTNASASGSSTVARLAGVVVPGHSRAPSDSQSVHHAPSHQRRLASPSGSGYHPAGVVLVIATSRATCPSRRRHILAEPAPREARTAPGGGGRARTPTAPRPLG